MPTGIPNDPIAYAAKQAIASQKRAAAKAAKLSTPAKRVLAADAESVQTTVTVEDPAKRVHKKRAYTPRKSSRPSVVKEDVLVQREKKIEELEVGIAGSEQYAKELEIKLKDLNKRYDEAVNALEVWQDRASDLQLYLTTVLDLVANQKSRSQ